MPADRDAVSDERSGAIAIYRLLWVGRAGFGVVWRGVEHQFYRDLDGSMGKRWTHQNLGAWIA